MSCGVITPLPAAVWITVNEKTATSLRQIFAADGALAAAITGFRPRTAQSEMAIAVATAMADQTTLVAEAGTGTGKTFAYLVPALLTGQAVIISTGTRTLQDQLYFNDLPLLQKALGRPVTTALLKGRSNYLCPHRLELTLNGERLQSRQEVTDLQIIRQWAATTQRGDITECGSIAESASIWHKVTSTRDNCLGNECEQLNRCYLNAARRETQEAEIIVINHHLFFASAALREEGLADILPEPHCILFDEAHQLPETATHFFGTTVSGHQLLELVRDTVNEDREAGGEDRNLPKAAHQLEREIGELRGALGEEGQRAAWEERSQAPPIQQGLQQVVAQLDRLLAHLEPQRNRTKGLESCHSRATEIRQRLLALRDPAPTDQIRWFETHSRSFTLHTTPLQIGDRLQQQRAIWPKSSWIFTSATLTVANRFDHFLDQMGLSPESRCHRWSSPFDYRHQALLYVPPTMPEPNDPHYTDAVIAAARPVIEAAEGGVFLLFTSHRALERGATLLREQPIPYPLLVQGEGTRHTLLEQFRQLGNGVLLGTSSFWEGIDVRGEALTAVIIDRLPFASPADPVLQARIERIRQAGLQPFTHYQIPQAVLTLKQGAGRLIRDVDDYGVLMLCDPRLTQRSYGTTFLDSLPPMSRTHKLEVVHRFYAWHQQRRLEQAAAAPPPPPQPTRAHRPRKKGRVKTP